MNTVYITLENNTDVIVSNCVNEQCLSFEISGIYSSEFVLSAVMTQYLNYDMAYKKNKKIN